MTIFDISHIFGFYGFFKLFFRIVFFYTLDFFWIFFDFLGFVEIFKISNFIWTFLDSFWIFWIIFKLLRLLINIMEVTTRSKPTYDKAERVLSEYRIFCHPSLSSKLFFWKTFIRKSGKKTQGPMNLDKYN